jgi:hypothetical protein
VTGNRLADGKVLSDISFFDLSENEHKTLIIRLRKNLSDNRDRGTVDLESILSLLDKSKRIPDKIGEKGAVIIWIDPEKEPSKHIINDLALLKNELDEWGGEFLLLTDPFQAKTRINSNFISGLPSKTYYGNDNNMESFKKSVNIVPETDIKMPVVLLSDKNGKILYSSTGYQTGIGEQILKNIN